MAGKRFLEAFLKAQAVPRLFTPLAKVGDFIQDMKNQLSDQSLLESH